MTGVTFMTVSYAGQDRQVTWRGVKARAGGELDAFLVNDVAERLQDKEGDSIFATHLRGVAGTLQEQNSLNEILAAEWTEEREWSVGEAIAEAYLARGYDVVWPWNMARDKRHPRASLPGADLVGFRVTNGKARLVLGEVKTSSDPNAPPGVMSGNKGMPHQIGGLAGDPSLIVRLLKWLFPRCKNTEHEARFNEAMTLFFSSGNKAVALIGVLIRDTDPSELDLKAGGRYIAERIQTPTTCRLIAIYLPFAISDLPARVAGGGP